MPKNPFEYPVTKTSTTKLNIVLSELPGAKPVKLDPVEALSEFAKVLEGAGLVLHGLPEATGNIVRVSTSEDKRGKKSGWYVLHDGDVVVGTYGNFKTGIDPQHWSSMSIESMTPSQITEYHRLRDEAKKQREKEQKRIWKEAAKEAAQIWSDGKALDSHTYLDKKKLSVSGKVSTTEGQYVGWLMVPLYDDNGDIASIQFIDSDGKKRFMSGGRKNGCYYLTNGDTDTIYVAEGYATGETITELTGKACAVAWDAGNLMPVSEIIRTRFPNSVVIVAGDNDHEHECGGCNVMVKSGVDDCPSCGWKFPHGNINVGYEKATSAASALGLNAIFPACQSGESDFNDIYVNHGKDAALEQLIGREKDYDNSKKAQYNDMPTHLLNPPGILADMTHYYNATARAPQPGFAVQTALSIASVVIARRYKTTKNNFSSLYFLNIAKTGTGKEHIKTVIYKILHEAGHTDKIRRGYTSPGAIFSALYKNPRHITVIDEMGIYLGAGKVAGNLNYQGVRSSMLQLFAEQQTMTKASDYSKMTRLKEDDGVNDLIFYNPGVSVVGITTPSTFYESISGGEIADGFINRFLLHHSHQERLVHDDPDDIAVPSRIVKWIKSIDERAEKNGQEFSHDVPNFVQLSFDSQSINMMREFNQYQIDLQNSLEVSGLSELPSRMKEIAMKVALVAALAKNPQANIIDHESTSWAIQYVKFSVEQTIIAMKENVSDSEFEAHKKEALKAIRTRGPFRMAQLPKTRPFSKHKPRDLNDIVNALVESELVIVEDVNDGGKGRPYKRIRAIEK